MKFDFIKRTSAVVAGRHEPERIRVLANLYWRALLVVFLIIVITVLLYGIFGTLRVLRDLNGPGNVSAPPPPSLDRTILNAIIEGFENRQSQFNLLKTTRGKVIPDPSR